MRTVPSAAFNQIACVFLLFQLHFWCEVFVVHYMLVFQLIIETILLLHFVCVYVRLELLHNYATLSWIFLRGTILTKVGRRHLTFFIFFWPRLDGVTLKICLKIFCLFSSLLFLATFLHMHRSEKFHFCQSQLLLYGSLARLPGETIRLVGRA